MATIKEIAELAGVSRGTVDRVLNHRGAVNSRTAEKIEEIAKALDYRPNRAGIVLAAQKKRLKLGVILFSADNPFFDDVLAGVHAKEEELSGYNCTVVTKRISYGVNTKIAVAAQIQAIEELVREDVNGIAMAPYNDEAIRQKIHELYNKGIPVVTLNTDIERSDRIAYVGSHYMRSGETAAGLMALLTDGHAKVGIITGSSHILCHTERIAGFTHTLEDRYPDIHVVDTIENQDEDVESYEKTRSLLLAHPEITALFFAAGGVYGGCRAVLSLAPLRPIKIVSNDLVPTTLELLRQGVISATICQQPVRQGSKSLDILFTYLSTGELPDHEFIYTDIDIRIRESSTF